MLLSLVKRCLLVTGVAMLTYAGFAIAETRLTQHYESLKFDRSLELLPRSPARSLATGDPVGRITIPSLGISAIVLEGDDARTLKVAPGHIPGTALPSEDGNVAIAAHRDTFFRNLGRIHVGDQITLTTLRRAYRYQVDAMRVVDPDATDILSPNGRPMLTLITCYPFHLIGPAPKRFIVQSHLLDD